MITINGKEYNSFKEWANEMKNDPTNTNLIWEYQRYTSCIFMGGKMVNMDGTNGVGKCTYRGKTYEGEITYIGNSLYVGGEYVKEV